ncbi:MAG: hypothetical protein ACREIT_11580 [Tepidisphaeraceae bacterium]
MTIRFHAHALARLKERGATKPEVEYAIRHGRRFAYNRKWLGRSYAHKQVEALAVDQGGDQWLVITVIVRFY